MDHLAGVEPALFMEKGDRQMTEYQQERTSVTVVVVESQYTSLSYELSRILDDISYLNHPTF